MKSAVTAPGLIYECMLIRLSCVLWRPRCAIHFDFSVFCPSPLEVCQTIHFWRTTSWSELIGRSFARATPDCLVLGNISGACSSSQSGFLKSISLKCRETIDGMSLSAKTYQLTLFLFQAKSDFSTTLIVFYSFSFFFCSVYVTDFFFLYKQCSNLPLLSVTVRSRRCAKLFFFYLFFFIQKHFLANTPLNFALSPVTSTSLSLPFFFFQYIHYVMMLGFFFLLLFSLNNLSRNRMGLVCITSWNPKFNRSHFGVPPSAIHRVTGLGGNFEWTMTYVYRSLSILVFDEGGTACVKRISYHINWFRIEKTLPKFCISSLCRVCSIMSTC